MYIVGGYYGYSLSNVQVSARLYSNPRGASRDDRIEALTLREVTLCAGLHNFEEDEIWGIGLFEEKCKKEVESLNMKTQA